MSRLTKVLLGIGAFFALSGGLLALTGGIMGGERSMTVTRDGRTINISPFGIHSYGASQVWESSEGGSGIQDLDMEAFDAVKLEVAIADIDLVVSDSYGVELSWFGGDYSMSRELKDGALRIWSPSLDDRYGEECGGTITLYVPDGAELKELHAEVGIGDVDLYGLVLRGDLLVYDGMGDVTVSAEVGGDATIDSGMGQISVSGGLDGDIELNTGMGDITVETGRPRSDYSLDLDSGMGEITLDGEAEKGHVKSGGGGRMLEANCGMGSIDVSFGA